MLPTPTFPVCAVLSHELLMLLAVAFAAGLVDAAVGGGGLIQIPGLFAT